MGEIQSNLDHQNISNSGNNNSQSNQISENIIQVDKNNDHFINVNLNVTNKTNFQHGDTSSNTNINSSTNPTAIHEESKEAEKKILNQEYYDEFNRPKYEDIVQYENQIRQEIENTSPLVSDSMNIEYLMKEFKGTIFEGAISDVMKKYKFIRTVRRDGKNFC